MDTSYALATTNPTVNEPVFVEFTIHNWLSEGVVSELAMNYHGYGGFWGKITRPDGQTDEGPKVHPSELVAIERVSIAPSESSSKILLVNKWFDFDEPGRYVLEVGIKKPLRTESGVKVTERASGRLIIEVGPRDPVRLEKICARLEREILASPGASSAAAEEALTHIKDPVAVPFLAHLLQAQDGKLAYVYAAALEHIADGPAIDALSDFVNDKSEDRRESARSSLDRIARRSDDLAIKRKIAEALR
ncbi:MAG: HEAT repeat domain-containing protein [Bryobacteraceae bacterium]